MYTEGISSLLQSLTEVSTYLEMQTSLQEATHSLTSTVQTSVINYLLPLFCGFAFIKAAYSYFRKKEQPGVDYFELFRVLMICILIVIYRSVMGNIDAISNRFIAGFDQNVTANLDDFYKISTVGSVTKVYDLTEEEQKELYQQLTGNQYSDATKVEDFIDDRNRDNDGLFASLDLATEIKKLTNKLTNLVQGQMSSNVYLLMSIIKLVMLTLIMGINILLFVGGPLALCVDILWKGKANGWFSIWMTTKASYLVFMIIESLVLYIMEINSSNFAAGASADLSWSYNYLLPGILISSIVMYLLVFTISGWFVGSGKAGAILSAAAGIAMMGANTAVGSVMKVAGKTAPTSK